jgi:hypothetical protein
MSQPDKESIALPLVALMALLAWAAYHSFASSPLHARLVSWHEKPATYVAEAAADAARTLPERTAANVVARLTDPLRPYAVLFLILCFGLLHCPRLIRAVGPFLSWPTWLHIACGCITAAIGLGAICSIPAAWPAVMRIIGLVAGGANLVAAAACLVVGLAPAGDGRHKLRYGPSFDRPTARPTNSILAGEIDRRIIPNHARWIAQRSGEIRIPYDRLSCGVTVIGEKGSGKSRLLFNFHDAIRARYPHIPIVIHDPKGEWFRSYYNPDADLVFAPHFKGTSSWSLWSDFKDIPQLRHELIAAAVYAHDNKDDRFWLDSAVNLLLSVSNAATLDAAAYLLAKMREENREDKSWLSIFSTAMPGLLDIAKVELCPSGDDGPKSIKEYLRWPGRIFLLNDPSCATEQKGTFSLFLSAFLLRALSGPDMEAGKLRAVAIIDEALTFNLPADVDRRIYALCRSKGLSIISGAQRLPDRHGGERGEWQTAEYLIGMKVISQETQASLSRRAGQIVYDEPHKGRSESDGRVATSESQRGEKMDAIPPEHFGRLEPRQFILFHDRGLVSGRTAEVSRPQYNRRFPAYDPREEIYEFARRLQQTGGGETCQSGRVLELSRKPSSKDDRSSNCTREGTTPR